MGLTLTSVQVRSLNLQRFSVDFVGVRCIKDGQKRAGGNRDLLNNFVVWCRRNYLLLKVAMAKAKEKVNYRRKRTTTSNITIMGQDLELNNTLWIPWFAFPQQARSVQNKDKRQYFLRKLSSGPLGVCNKMLEILHQHVVAKASFLAAEFWERAGIRARVAKPNQQTDQEQP